jgi:hypothetical protein
MLKLIAYWSVSAHADTQLPGLSSCSCCRSLQHIPQLPKTAMLRCGLTTPRWLLMPVNEHCVHALVGNGRPGMHR